jgi:putative transposase
MDNLRTRKHNRLKDYDYATDGFYFITICSKNGENIFSDIPVGADGCRPTDPINVQLNDFGRIVGEELKKSQNIRDEIIVDYYVIMPNHVHCIIVIEQNGMKITGRQPSAPTCNRKRSLSSFVQGFKSAVTARINTLRNMPGEPVWQRSFHDHIIRNERSLHAIREYIANNPIHWEQDIENLLSL